MTAPVIPTILGVNYKFDSNKSVYSIAVTARPDTPPPGNLVASLYENGVSTAFQNANGVIGTFNFTDPLSPYISYAVGMQYDSGPSSALVPVLVTPPIVRSVSYDGATVTVSAELPTGVQSAPGALFEMHDITAEGKPIVGSGYGGGTTIVFPTFDTVDTTHAFEIYPYALNSISQGLAGASAPMIVQTTALTTLSYDGTRVSGTWTTANGSNISSHLLHVLVDGKPLCSAKAGQTAGFVDVTLDPASSYTAALQGIGEGSGNGVAPIAMSGPIAAGVAVIAAAPSVGGITFSDKTVSAQINPPPLPPAGTSYFANLYLGGQKVAGPVAAVGAPPLAVFNVDVLGKPGYTIRAYSQNVSGGTTVTGPLGPAAQVLSVTPRIVSVLVATDPQDSAKFAVNVAWSLPEAPLGAITVSMVTLWQGITQVYGSSALTATTAAFSVPMHPVDTTQPVVFNVLCAGPSGSSPNATVNVAFVAPALTTSTNDDGEVASQWAWAPANASAQGAATGYRYLVYAMDQNFANPRLTYMSESTQSLAGSVSLAEAGALGLDNIATAIAVDCGVGRFLSDPAAAVIVHRPTLSGTTVSGTTLQIAMTAPSVPTGTTITGYLARFWQGDMQVASAAIASTTSPLSVDLTSVTGLPNNPLWPVTVTLAAVAGSVTGPDSQALHVLRQTASAASAEASTANVLARWTPALGPVDAYRVDVVQTPAGTVIGTASSAGTEVAVPISSATAGNSYQLQVTPSFGGASGPPSTALPLALLAPTLGTVSFDGQTLTLAVTAPNVGSTSITGYRVVVTCNGITVLSVDTASGSSITVPFVAAEPQAAYQVSIAAMAGTALGPQSTSVPFVTATPRITKMVCPNSLVVTFDPTPVTNSGATFQGILYTGGVAGSPVAANNDNTITFTVASGVDTQVAVRAVLNGGNGPLSEKAKALVTAPALTSSAYDGSKLDLAFASNATDPDGTYLLTVKAGLETVQQAVMKGLSTTLTFDADTTHNYTLTAQQVTDIAIGPGMAAAGIFTLGCEITSIDYTNSTTARVGWITHAGNVNFFEVDAINEGRVTVVGTYVSNMVLSFDVSSLPPTGNLIAVRISNAGPTYGPTGTPLPLLREAPRNLSAYYNGRAIIASWDAVADPNVTGYVASLTVGSNNPITISSTGTHLSYPFDLADAPSISLSVVAACGVSKGPSSATVNVLTGNPAFYVGDLSGAVMPAVYPSLSVAPAAAELMFYLPELFATHQTTAITQGPFTLTPITPVTPPYAYTVTIPAYSGLWSFTDASARQTIAAQFASFLNSIASTTGASVQAPRIVQQTLASGLPLSFVESLAYRYSFDPAMRFVDLQAGMRLEIRYESFQYVNGSAPTNGYVTGASAIYEIADLPGDGGVRFTAIDPFLGSLQAINFQSPQQGGAGGEIDLQTAAYRRPYLRLFYPQSFPASQSQGSTSLNSAVAIVAATNWSALDTLTQSFISLGSLPAPSADCAINYFRGRAVLTPLIAVSVNGASRFVALGTTLGTVLAGEGLPPDLAQIWLSGISLARPVTPNLPTAEVNSNGIVLASRRPVMVTYQQYAAFADETTVLDLPLVQGDAIWIGSPGNGRPS